MNLTTVFLIAAKQALLIQGITPPATLNFPDSDDEWDGDLEGMTFDERFCTMLDLVRQWARYPAFSRNAARNFDRARSKKYSKLALLRMALLRKALLRKTKDTRRIRHQLQLRRSWC